MTAIPWCLYHGYHCLVQLFIWCYFCGSKRRVWIRKTSLDTYRILYRYLHSLSCMSSHEMQLFQSLEIPWIFAGWPIARARTPSGVRNRDGDRVVFQELRQRQRLTQQRMEEKCKEQKAKTQDAPGPLCFSMFFFFFYVVHGGFGALHGFADLLFHQLHVGRRRSTVWIIATVGSFFSHLVRSCAFRRVPGAM